MLSAHNVKTTSDFMWEQPMLVISTFSATSFNFQSWQQLLFLTCRLQTSPASSRMLILCTLLWVVSATVLCNCVIIYLANDMKTETPSSRWFGSMTTSCLPLKLVVVFILQTYFSRIFLNVLLMRSCCRPQSSVSLCLVHMNRAAGLLFSTAGV